MHIVRVFRSSVVLVGLGCFGLAVLPGCGDDTPPSGEQVKVDPKETADRAKKIQDMYKSNPPQSHGAGPGGPVAPPKKD